jgi:hypothetical protein
MASGLADLEAFGQMVLANPDFVARLKTGAPMKRIAPASLAAPRRAIPTIPRSRRSSLRKARGAVRHRRGPAGKSWRLFNSGPMSA